MKKPLNSCSKWLQFIFLIQSAKLMLSRNVVKQVELTGLMSMFNEYFIEPHSQVEYFENCYFHISIRKQIIQINSIRVKQCITELKKTSFSRIFLSEIVVRKLKLFVQCKGEYFLFVDRSLLVPKLSHKDIIQG